MAKARNESCQIRCTFRAVLSLSLLLAPQISQAYSSSVASIISCQRRRHKTLPFTSSKRKHRTSKLPSARAVWQKPLQKTSTPYKRQTYRTHSLTAVMDHRTAGKSQCLRPRQIERPSTHLCGKSRHLTRQVQSSRCTTPGSTNMCPPKMSSTKSTTCSSRPCKWAARRASVWVGLLGWAQVARITSNRY